MLSSAVSLVTCADGLRSGSTDLIASVDILCARLVEVDARILAFLPEPARCIRLRQEATTLMARYPHPRDRPALYGVPVGIKDLFRVDGLPTRAGSDLPPALFAGAEASVVNRLRQAGTLIAGKTAMDEFAYCEPPPTRNPHQLDHTPGGSSGGSAAAVAAGLCPLALGTQTTRSVIGPAAFCGVVGYASSFGRIPIDGVVPMAPSMDTVGFLTSDVPSMAVATATLVGDWRAAATESVRRPVLGIPVGALLTYTFPEARASFEAQLATLVRAGYEVRRVPMVPDVQLEDVYRQAITLLHGEMAHVHAPWFAACADRYRPRTAAAVRRGQTIPEAETAAAREGQIIFRSTLHARMETEGVDLWATPSSAGGAPAGFDVTGYGGMTTPWSYAGLPAVTVPAGRDSHGLPLGFQCIAAWGEDERLVARAAGIAQALCT